MQSPDKVIESLIKERGGKILTDNDLGSEKAIVLVASKPKNKANQEDENTVMRELYYHVLTRWVEKCVKEEVLCYFVDEDYNFLVYPPPKDVPHPIFSRLPKEFLEEDDQILKVYGVNASKKGINLDMLSTWENITKQTDNRLSRFSAQALKNRYMSFGKTPDKKRQKTAGGDLIDEEPEEDEEKILKKGTPKAKKPVPVPQKTKTTSTTLASPLPSPSKNTRYTKEDDEKMIKYAEEHANLVQSELWAQARDEGLIPDRTARSLQEHYSKLHERINRKSTLIVGRAPNFTGDEDETMFKWIHAWMETHGESGRYGKGIWKAAAAQNILPGRTAEQMFNHYKNSLNDIRNEGLALIETGGFNNTVPSPAFVVPRSPLSKVMKGGSPGIPSKGKATTTSSSSSSSSQHFTYPRNQEAFKFADEIVDRVREQVKNKSTTDIFRALYFTCCDEKAAIRVLNGAEPDSKYDCWTVEEDKLLIAGRPVNRPDVHRRRVFLGLELQGGF